MTTPEQEARANVWSLEDLLARRKHLDDSYEAQRKLLQDAIGRLEMTTIPTSCSFCGTTFSEAVVPNSVGQCRDALACARRKWAQEEAEKQKGEKQNDH